MPMLKPAFLNREHILDANRFAHYTGLLQKAVGLLVIGFIFNQHALLEKVSLAINHVYSGIVHHFMQADTGFGIWDQQLPTLLKQVEDFLQQTECWTPCVARIERKKGLTVSCTKVMDDHGTHHKNPIEEPIVERKNQRRLKTLEKKIRQFFNPQLRAGKGNSKQWTRDLTIFAQDLYAKSARKKFAELVEIQANHWDTLLRRRVRIDEHNIGVCHATWLDFRHCMICLGTLVETGSAYYDMHFKLCEREHRLCNRCRSVLSTLQAQSVVGNRKCFLCVEVEEKDGESE